MTHQQSGRLVVLKLEKNILEGDHAKLAHALEQTQECCCVSIPEVASHVIGANQRQPGQPRQV